jgi:hypothetical protein
MNRNAPNDSTLQPTAKKATVKDVQVEAFGRAWRSGCHLRAKLNRAPGTGRRELDNPETVIEREVGVEPPAQFAMKLLRAVNIRDRNDDHFELHIHSLGTSAADRFTARKRAQGCHISSLFVTQIAVQILACSG